MSTAQIGPDFLSKIMEEVGYPNKLVLFTSNLLFVSKVERSSWLYCECKFWEEVCVR